jgi:hypothetical protein
MTGSDEKNASLVTSERKLRVNIDVALDNMIEQNSNLSNSVGGYMEQLSCQYWIKMSYTCYLLPNKIIRAHGKSTRTPILSPDPGTKIKKCRMLCILRTVMGGLNVDLESLVHSR